MKIGLAISGLDQLKALRKKIQQFPVAAARASTKAANEVAAQVEVEAPRDITNEINLTPSYVHSKFRVRKATILRGVAIVSSRKRGTRLARFYPQQQTVSSPRAKGDDLRGISPGRKQAGVSVKVKRSGGRKVIKGAFLIPLRAGKIDGGNGMGIFVREGDFSHAQSIMTKGVFPGRYRWTKGVEQTQQERSNASTSGQLRHLYGPSVDQMFRGWILKNKPDIGARLAVAFRAHFARELRRLR